MYNQRRFGGRNMGVRKDDRRGRAPEVKKEIPQNDEKKAVVKQEMKSPAQQKNQAQQRNQTPNDKKQAAERPEKNGNIERVRPNDKGTGDSHRSRDFHREDGQNKPRGGKHDHGRPDRFNERDGNRDSNQNRGNFRQSGGDRFNRGQQVPQQANIDPQNLDLDLNSANKKFTGRCRLFVGNLPNDTSEADFKKLFEPYGEISETFINSQKGFGFVRMETRQVAEAAKAGLDGLQTKGRILRVRFATHGAALKVKHLSPHVSNELLEQAFTIFGQIERAVVIVDDRGKSTGEGIVEFARKPGAQQALNRINSGVFLISASPRPVVVEPLEQKDEDDGLPEKFINRNPQFMKDREQPPRFAQPNSFEFDFAQKWKDLYRMEEEQKAQLSRQMEEAAAKLEMDMGAAQIEHQSNLLRQDYLRKQEELKRMEEMHQQEVQRRMEMSGFRRQEEDIIRRRDNERRQQEMMIRQQQEEEMRRRHMQERGGPNEMFGGPGGPQRDMRERNAPPMQPPPAPPAGLGLDRPRHQMGGQGGMDGSGNQPRQSRFDQPPPNFGGQGMGGNMMGNQGNQSGMIGGSGLVGGGQMGGQGPPQMGGNQGPIGGSLGGNPMQGGNQQHMRNQPHMERMGGNQMSRAHMDRRDRGGRDDFEPKRPRRY